jgi:predicted kinase
MKPKKVFILSGPPASGKSTWVRANLTPGSEWISRDNVRFSIVGKDEEYFSHEEEVFDTFINYINQTLENPDIHTIYIDATHLNRRSRNKTLNRVRKQYIEELNCVCFTASRELCQARNALRSGRERVPSSAIDNMYNAFAYPTAEEGFTHVYAVNAEGITKEVNF